MSRLCLQWCGIQTAARSWVALLPWLIALPLKAGDPGGPLAPANVADRDKRVSFHREVLPLLKANCLPCHNQTRAQAGLVLETRDTMLKGGDSGPALVPSKPDESLLFRTAAHLETDLVMPPPDNKVNARALTADELGLLRRWIEQGAEADEAEALAFAWQPIPTNVVSSFAVALTPDGHTVAVARANRVTLYDTRSGKMTGQLIDPALDGAAQRDWVNALAFSPDGETLAAAGFREVRLWRRGPVMVEPALATTPDAPWQAAAIAPGGRQLAVVTVDERLEIRRIEDGNLVVSPPLKATPPLRFAWSDVERHLAVGGANGVIQVTGTQEPGDLTLLRMNEAVTALTWFDHDRRLMAATQNSSVIRVWRMKDADNAFKLADDSAELWVGHPATVTAIAAEHGPDGRLVSAADDGVIRRWGPDQTAPAQEARVAGAVNELVVIGSVARVVAIQAGNTASIITFGDSVRVEGPLGGDPQRIAQRQAEEAEIALCRAELARATTLIQGAEAANKSAGETLGKAREKRETDAKTLAAKEGELAAQKEIESAAEKELNELDAELQRASDSLNLAEKTLEAARAAATRAAEMEAAAQIAASSAERLHAELERILVSSPESDTGPAATMTREAAHAAAAEAATLSGKKNEAIAAAGRAREDLAARAFAAGQRKAEADRAQADLPPRKKQAEERLAAARKSISNLQPQVEKLRITLDGSTQDVALAEAAATRAAASLEAAKNAEQKARERIAATEVRLEQIQSEMARPAEIAAVAGQGTILLTIQSNGRASRWDVESGAAVAAFDWPVGTPLALAALSEDEFLTVASNGVWRVNTRQDWTLHRVLGGADQSASTGAFVDRVNALAFSPDGQWLATGGGEPSRSGELKLWRVEDGGLARDFGGLHSDCVMALAFSPRGEWLASGGADRFARVTPLFEGASPVNLEGHVHHVLDVAWLGDGGTLATAGAEGVVKLWDTRTWERRKNVEGFGKEITGLERAGFSQQFVALSGSGTGRIFKADGEKVRDLTVANVFLQCLAVSRDGRLAAGSGEDGVLRLWNLADGKPLLILTP